LQGAFAEQDYKPGQSVFIEVTLWYLRCMTSLEVSFKEFIARRHWSPTTSLMAKMLHSLPMQRSKRF